VQGVSVVCASRLQTGADEAGDELIASVDTNVAALDLVIGVGERPADPLGEPARNGHSDPPSRGKDANDLGDRGPVVGDVLEDLGGDDPIEALVRERNRKRVAAHCLRRRSRRCLAGLGHRGKRRRDRRQLALVAIKRNDVCASSVRLEGMTATAAADVEHAVPCADAEPVEIKGQQDGLLSAIGVGGGRLTTASPIRLADARAATPIASA
jgi:hypothetical protein